MKVLEESSPEEKTIFLLDAMTGLRRGEGLALQWRDIDWLSHEMIVQQAICKFRSTDGVHKYVYRLGTTKNERLRRVALPPSVYQALRHLYQTAQNQAPDSFLFTRNGTFINPEYFTKWMALPFLKRATDGRLKRFHDLRHFFVSMLIDQGESPKYIQDQVGHASITMTMDTYGHLMPQAREEAAAKLEKSLFDTAQKLPLSSSLAETKNRGIQDKIN